MSLPTTSPTDALVDDILIETFTFLASPSRQSFRNVLAVSHVCTRWRKLALSSPELWRRFAFLTRDEGDIEFRSSGGGEDEKFTDEMLNRCGEGVTLDVGWEHWYSRPAGTVRRELGMRDRLRTYRLPLVVGSDFWWGVITRPPNPTSSAERQCKTTKPLGALEDLSLLDVGFQGDLMHLPLVKVGWLVGEGLCIPALRKLVLRNISMDVQLLSLPKLENLDWEIERHSLPWAEVPIPCIFETLGAHTGLRRLRIHQGHAIKMPLLPGFQLGLPRLEELDLTTDFTCLSLLLAHLSLPRCRTVKIKFLRSTHPGAEYEDELVGDRGMVWRVTQRIIDRMVVPLISKQEEDKGESSGNTLSFIRCEDTKVEYVFSPRMHDTPHWARDPRPDDLTIVMGFLPSGRPWRGTNMRGVLDGWMSASHSSSSGPKIGCLDLPDDPLVASEYGKLVEGFVRYPSVGVERIICSLYWAREVVDGVIKPTVKGRFRAADPPVEIVTTEGRGVNVVSTPVG